MRFFKDKYEKEIADADRRLQQDIHERLQRVGWSAERVERLLNGSAFDVSQQPAAGPHKPPFPVPTQTQEAPATMFQRHTLCESSDEMPHRWVVVDTLGGRRIGDAWAGAILASYPAWTSRVANQGWEAASRAVMLPNIVADEEDLWVRLNT